MTTTETFPTSTYLSRLQRLLDKGSGDIPSRDAEAAGYCAGYDALKAARDLLA